MALSYIGNNDFRGYLNYLGSQGDYQAKRAVSGYGTGYVDNSGTINTGLLNELNQAAPGDTNPDTYYQQQATDYLKNAYSTWQAGQGSVLGDSTDGGTSGPSAADIALYDQAIGNTNAAIGRLPGQQAAGQAGIDTSYQNAFNTLLQGKNQSEGAYNTNKTQTAQDWRTAKNTIGTNAGNSLSGLLRLLGSRGAGGSAAYQFSAPNAVIQGQNQQNSGVAQTYGRNQQSLDTNWNNYLRGYNNSVSDIGSQRDTNKASLNDQINTQKASLLQTLAQLTAQKTGSAGPAQPYIDQANSLLDSVGRYVAPAINYQTQAYNAPSLDSYTVNPNAAPKYSSQGNDSFISPYLSALLGKNKDKLAYGA